MPHESPLHSVHSLGRDEGSLSLNELTDLCTSLSKKVEEQKVKTTKARRKARIVLSEDEEDVEDSSKHERKISEIDKDPTISLVQPEQEMEHGVDIRSGEKGASEVSSANIVVTTTKPEPEKKTKKQLEQERLRHEEAVRLQEQLNEEETQRIARDTEIARQLHEEINKA
ncbi:hypothetical protein Tco_1498155 [Tanacetum coccineum]